MDTRVEVIEDAEGDLDEADVSPEELARMLALPTTHVTSEPVSAVDVARWFLRVDGATDSWRLQKLCYYAQAEYLARFDTRLFREPVEAWQHGPVIRPLYQLHHHKREVLPSHLGPGDLDGILEDETVVEVLNDVLAIYGHMSGAELRELTHREQPWQETRANGLKDDEIPVELIRDYYRSLRNIPEDPDGSSDDS